MSTPFPTYSSHAYLNSNTLSTCMSQILLSESSELKAYQHGVRLIPSKAALSGSAPKPLTQVIAFSRAYYTVRTIFICFLSLLAGPVYLMVNSGVSIRLPPW